MRLKLKRKHPKSKKQKLREKLEKLVSEYVKLRDGYICQKCSIRVEGSNCHASHVIPKSHGDALRFDPLNLKVLCMHCHLHWWHKNPLEAQEWFKDKFLSKYEYLMIKKESIKKYTIEMYEEEIKQIEMLTHNIGGF